MPKTTQQLRILSYNVKMLPGPFGKGDADLARLQDIAATVVATKPGWDVLCFQEVFDEDARGLLSKKLKKTFPHQVIKCSDHDVFHEDSGLFFASRFPIAGKGFAEYTATADEDSLADKGIFGARVDVKGTQVLIFNTHLQASVKHFETRAAQLRQARTFVRGALQRLPRMTEAVAIACGDYNVVAEAASPGSDALGPPTDEYQRMIARLGWPRDLFREGRPQAPGYTWDGFHNKNMIPKDDKDRQRLDYLFAFDQVPPVHDDEVCPTIRKAHLEDVAVLPFEAAKPGNCLSDHFAVSATVAF